MNSYDEALSRARRKRDAWRDFFALEYAAGHVQEILDERANLSGVEVQAVLAAEAEAAYEAAIRVDRGETDDD